MNDAAVAAFQNLYHQLQRGNVDKATLATVYGESIQFKDPFHNINGLDAMTRYFVSMYENVESIEFTFGHCWQEDNHAFIRWQMVYQHPRINSGKPVTVDGGSELIWGNDKIIQHRDFFDGGQMLYEHLPLLGWAIRKLKERMS
jgi:hypothetical protein